MGGRWLTEDEIGELVCLYGNADFAECGCFLIPIRHMGVINKESLT